MVNNPLIPSVGPSTERALAIGYARADRRAALTTLLTLDEALGAILRSTREPLVGQMRLVWWRDALEALDTRPPPAEPLLAAVARDLLPGGVRGEQLATMVDGWEALLGEPLDEAAFAAHASARGGGVFAAAANILGGGDAPWRVAGEGWALADLARNLSRPALAACAAESARDRLAAAFAVRWPAPLRPLGALALSASMDLQAAPRPPEHPARVWRLLRFRLTGR